MLQIVCWYFIVGLVYGLFTYGTKNGWRVLCEESGKRALTVLKIIESTKIDGPFSKEERANKIRTYTTLCRHFISIFTVILWPYCMIMVIITLVSRATGSSSRY